MASSSISIRPVTPSDFDELAHLEASAWDNDAFVITANGPADVRHSAPFITHAVQVMKKTLADPHHEMIKAVNENGEAVGLATWASYYEPHIWDDSHIRPENDDWPEGMNAEMWKDFNKRCRIIERKNREGRRYVGLELMIVSPKHQRKGIGNLLLDYGIRRADEEKLPMFLGSSPEGQRLYLKNGFQLTDEFDMDLRKYGGPAEFKHWFMCRPVH